jgi:hypothetical protein
VDCAKKVLEMLPEVLVEVIDVELLIKEPTLANPVSSS